MVDGRMKSPVVAIVSFLFAILFAVYGIFELLFSTIIDVNLLLSITAIAYFFCVIGMFANPSAFKKE